VKNLFDKDPPLTNQRYTFQSGFDPSYYDAFPLPVRQRELEVLLI
jgi:hypothetical protein